MNPENKINFNTALDTKLILLEALRDYGNQDRQVSRDLIREVNGALGDYIAFYRVIRLLEHEPSELKDLCNHFNSSKENILKDMQENYSNELNFLKNIGGNYSPYPMSLSWFD